MKSVLCYGDSNTYGAVPGSPGGRMAHDERWPGVLRAQLGDEWLVIEEGLCGRTTVSDDPVEGNFLNGRTYLLPCLASHKPLDLVVLMLGTNDLKARFHKSASEIALGVGALVRDIKASGAGPDETCPRLLVIAPPPILDDLKGWDNVFEGGHEKSLGFATEMQAVAEANGVDFIDAGECCLSSPVDGFHIDKTGARNLGLTVAEYIKTVQWPGTE